ncbi:MAG: NrtA/SsuA/CpmA family ABC transporter substrate-binding protein [Christensenellales bacterium]|nr:NrtA/SsuA/CpmA family ABC transporter substrate-binding protein [Christensenellales bacterium]
MKFKRVMALLLAGMMVMALTGCAGDGKLKEITMTYVTSPLNVPTIVEKNHGIFLETLKESGVEKVSYSEITSGADQTQALASGDIQFLYAVGATSVLLSAANDADIRIISMYSRSPKAFCLFSGDESISSPEALRGKTIAGPQGTILHELLVAYLATADMTLEDVSFVNTTIPDAMSALLGGKVDCALLAGAAAYNTQQSGAHLVTDGEGLVEATICCATTNAFYEKHRDLVEGFLKAQKNVLSYMEENREAALQETAEYLDLDPAAVEDMYAYYDFDPEIRDSDIEAMTSTMNFMLENGMIEQAVDVNALVIR